MRRGEVPSSRAGGLAFPLGRKYYLLPPIIAHAHDPLAKLALPKAFLKKKAGHEPGKIR